MALAELSQWIQSMVSGVEGWSGGVHPLPHLFWFQEVDLVSPPIPGRKYHFLGPVHPVTITLPQTSPHTPIHKIPHLIRR